MSSGTNVSWDCAANLTLPTRLIKEDVDLLRRDTWPLSLGVSGGLLAAVTMAISQDFESLRDAYIVAMGAVCRLCKFAVS